MTLSVTIEPILDLFYVIEPHGRFWAVYENPDQLLIEETLSGPPEKRLVVVCVYKRGAEEVKRRLTSRVRIRTRHAFWRDKQSYEDEEEEDGPR